MSELITVRFVSVDLDTALTLYKIAFEAHGLSEKDLRARRELGRAIQIAESGRPISETP